MPRSRDLTARRIVQLELPEFLLCALESRVAEANVGAPMDDLASLNDYVESELVNIITLRDVAELETDFPGFAGAVQQWLAEMSG
ncbi:MAG TPA: hypothetical protein VF618_18595 [Thermoanaerobaculia bacterium]